MNLFQRAFGFLINQKIVNKTIVVDEKYMAQLLQFENNPSDVNSIILALYEAISEDNPNGYKVNVPPEINEKIDFNNVIVYRPIIEKNYCENGYFIDSAYEALDSDTPGRKRTFMRYINFLYLSILGEMRKENPSCSQLDVIRANADTILVQIINTLLLKVANNTDSLEHLSIESIEYNVIAIVCHAFVDCKVLENPNGR